jgi:hypothetical protein
MFRVIVLKANDLSPQKSCSLRKEAADAHVKDCEYLFAVIWITRANIVCFPKFLNRDSCSCRSLMRKGLTDM